VNLTFSSRKDKHHTLEGHNCMVVVHIVGFMFSVGDLVSQHLPSGVR
jgi:hypothetical protein